MPEIIVARVEKMFPIFNKSTQYLVCVSGNFKILRFHQCKGAKQVGKMTQGLRKLCVKFKF